MKIKITIFFLLFLLIPMPSWSGRCTGSSNCTACKNCSSCKYCSEEGGSCGVCSYSGEENSSNYSQPVYNTSETNSSYDSKSNEYSNETNLASNDSNSVETKKTNYSWIWWVLGILVLVWLGSSKK